MFVRHVAVLAGLLVLSEPLLASPSGPFAFGQPGTAAMATRTIEVRMRDMAFEPKAIEVKSGETVRFVLKNEGQVLHEFNLGDAAMHARHQGEMLQMVAQGTLTPTGLKKEAMDHAAMGHGSMSHDDPNSVLVEPGKTAELTWTFKSAENLQFACNVPGHYQAGMVGELKIDR